MNYQKEQTFGVGPDLDLNTSDMSWNVAPAHDPRSVGNRVLEFPQTSNPENNTSVESVPELATSPNAPKLGKIITLTPEPKTTETKSFDQTVLSIKGDRITKESVIEAKKLENKLSQDGDVSNFYDNAREMTDATLKNSFGRQLYSNKSEGKAA